MILLVSGLVVYTPAHESRMVYARCTVIHVSDFSGDGKVFYREIVPEISQQPDYSAVLAGVRRVTIRW